MDINLSLYENKIKAEKTLSSKSFKLLNSNKNQYYLKFKHRNFVLLSTNKSIILFPSLFSKTSNLNSIFDKYELFIFNLLESVPLSYEDNRLYKFTNTVDSLIYLDLIYNKSKHKEVNSKGKLYISIFNNN